MEGKDKFINVIYYIYVTYGRSTSAKQTTLMTPINNRMYFIDVLCKKKAFTQLPYRRIIN